MTQTFAGGDSVDVLCFEDLILVVLMNGTLLGNQEAGTALYAASTQHEGCCDSSAVCNAAGSQNRNLNCVAYLWNQGHGGQLTDVSAGFAALCDNCKGAASLHQSCHSGGCNDRNHLDACLHPFLHVFARVACTGNNDRNFFLNDQVGYLIGKRAHQHDVDAERLVGQLACLVNLLTQPRGVCVHRCDDAQSTGIADCCSKRCIRNPGHTALKDWIFDI